MREKKIISQHAKRLGNSSSGQMLLSLNSSKSTSLTTQSSLPKKQVLFSRNCSNISKNNLFQDPKKTLYNSEPMRLAYDEIKTAVVNGVDVARSQGKKALLLAGEIHGRREAMILELMILSVANNQGIKDLCVELSPCLVSKYSTKISHYMSKEGLAYFDRYDKVGVAQMEGLDDRYCVNWINAYEVTKDKFNLNITGIESPHLDYFRWIGTDLILCNKPMMRWRNNYMAQQMVDTDRDILAMVGASHLHGLMTNSSLNTKYHVVGINITGLTTEHVRKTHYEEWHFTVNPEKVAQIPLKVDLLKDIYTIKTKDAVQQILEFCEEMTAEDTNGFVAKKTMGC